MTTVFETTDFEAVYQMLSVAYGVRRLSVPEGKPSLRLRKDDFGPFRLHHLTWGMRVEVTGDALGAFYFGHVLGGALTHDLPRDTVTYGAGDTFLSAEPDQPVHSKIESLEGQFVTLEAVLLAEVAATAPDRVPEPIRFTARLPASESDATTWLSTCAYVRDTFIPEAATTSPLVLAGSARLLAAAALATFPNNALRDPTIEDRNDAHPASLRRAVTFIDENAHRDISPAEIAGAAHVTIRALQLAFRRHLDATPMEYLRRVRLANAHDDLRTADPAKTTVTAIAARWGFPNHSRFTAHYHATYGTTPSRTLRRD